VIFGGEGKLKEQILNYYRHLCAAAHRRGYKRCNN
jgi:hypothetical protein